MPQSTLSWSRLQAALAAPLSESEFDELLFRSKAEVTHRAGDELTVSATPDRLDLLCEGGLAAYLDAARGRAPRPRPAPAGRGRSPVELIVDPNVTPIRPSIAAAVAVPPPGAAVDAGLLVEAFRFQELLAASVGRDRRRASLGVYALDRIQPPVRYALEAADQIRFVPLGEETEWSGERFVAEHPMGARYAPYGRVGEKLLVLRDATGTVLSVVPMLNSRAAGEARPGDRALLLEATGTDDAAVREALGLFELVWASRSWRITTVPVRGPKARGVRRAADPRSRVERLTPSLVRALLGRAIAGKEGERLFARAGLSSRPAANGWAVEIPPWRPDLRAPVDLVEELGNAAGWSIGDAMPAPSVRRGRRLAEVRFRRRFGPLLLGLGFVPVYRPVLVSERSIERTGWQAEAVRVHHPVSSEYAYVRPSVVVSLLDALADNRRYRYPQRISESGPVVRRDRDPDRQSRHAVGFVLAAERAGFSDAAAIVDRLLREFDVSSVRVPLAWPGFLAGRSAAVQVAGETVAYVGEVAPAVLTALGLTVPVAAGEIDVTALWPLARRDRV